MKFPINLPLKEASTIFLLVTVCALVFIFAFLPPTDILWYVSYVLDRPIIYTLSELWLFWLALFTVTVIVLLVKLAWDWF